VQILLILKILLSHRHPVGDHRVQRAKETRRLLRLHRATRQRRPVEGVRRQLDGVEPRSHGSGTRRSGVLRHGARVL